MHRNYEKLIFKNGALKMKISSLSKELKWFSKEKEVILPCDTCDSLKSENASLNEKTLDLTNIVHKFTNGKKNFDLMLDGQKCIFDKGGIGYKPFLKTKYLKNYFIKASSLNGSKYVCNYCNQNGHTRFSCSIKKDAYFGVKKEWVPKVSKTNSQGPKIMWVPKAKVWILVISTKEGDDLIKGLQSIDGNSLTLRKYFKLKTCSFYGLNCICKKS